MMCHMIRCPLQNFNIYKGMDASLSVAKNTVAFIGHEEGETVPYRIRMRTPDMAEGLRKAIEHEIQSIASK